MKKVLASLSYIDVEKGTCHPAVQDLLRFKDFEVVLSTKDKITREQVQNLFPHANVIILSCGTDIRQHLPAILHEPKENLDEVHFGHLLDAVTAYERVHGKEKAEFIEI